MNEIWKGCNLQYNASYITVFDKIVFFFKWTKICTRDYESLCEIHRMRGDRVHTEYFHRYFPNFFQLIFSFLKEIFFRFLHTRHARKRFLKESKLKAGNFHGEKFCGKGHTYSHPHMHKTHTRLQGKRDSLLYEQFFIRHFRVSFLSICVSDFRAPPFPFVAVLGDNVSSVFWKPEKLKIAGGKNKEGKKVKMKTFVRQWCDDLGQIKWMLLHFESLD